MEEYKPNSYKSKEEAKQLAERKKLEPIAKCKTRKKSKMRDAFIAEDAANIKSYVVMEVLIPAIKKAVADIVTDGISMLLYGDTGRGGKKRSSASYISYDRYSDRDRDRDRERARSRYSYDDIVLESSREAEDVIDRMSELLDMYGVVSVADLYDLVGITCDYTDNKYGWTNLRNADTVHVRDGYMLKLPKALPIK